MTPTEKKAQKRIAELRKFYKVGVEANQAGGRYGDKINEKIANKYERSVSSITHSRLFAKLIEANELEQICKLRNAKGAAMGPGVITKLFPLKELRDRDRFLRLWQKYGWSASELDAAIRGKFGKAKRTGRKAKQPKSSSEAIDQIRDRCVTWLKWYEELANVDAGEISLKDLPSSVRKQLQKTIAEVEKLHNVTTKVD